MALFIQRDRQLIAGLVLAAAFSTSGCSASRQLFSTTEKANSSRPVVIQANEIPPVQFGQNTDSQPAEISELERSLAGEIQLVAATDFANSDVLNSTPENAGALQVATTSTWNFPRCPRRMTSMWRSIC